MDREAWSAAIHGVAKSQPPPSYSFLFILFPLWPEVALGSAFLPKFEPIIWRGLTTRRL